MAIDLSCITEALIRQQASAESFRRGREYAEQGAVLSLSARGDALQAEVEGSGPEPYRVRVTFDAGGITSADCDCPYTWGGWCKHIVATLLTALNDPDLVEARPALDALLADLDRAQLETLLLRLAGRDPTLADLIEGQVALLRPGSADTPAAALAAGTRPRRMPVDTRAVRRQVHDVLHSHDRMRPSEAYWHVGGVVADVRGILEQAWAFIRAGEGEPALAVLEAITDEYVADWMTLDGSDGETGDFFSEIGRAWSEALLTADLLAKERAVWAEKLDAWADEIADYGIEDAFTDAQTVAEQGWETPSVGRVGQPAAPDEDDWGWDASLDNLIAAKLNVLERQGRIAEYLALADAAGESERHALMLVRLGRLDDAAAYGLARLATPAAALALAQALREHGDLAAALRVAEHGLALRGRKTELAVWLCDLATAMGEPAKALNAAVVAFRESPDVAAFLRVRELAGERWPEQRDDLLADLRQHRQGAPQGAVEVFLHEELIGDAIAAVDATPYAYDTIEQVVAAAVTSHPVWVIRTCRRQAEPIMEQGKSQHYHHAAKWLAHARDAYRAAGREDEWRAYLDELLAQHGRKYKLVPMLRALQT